MEINICSKSFRDTVIRCLWHLKQDKDRNNLILLIISLQVQSCSVAQLQLKSHAGGGMTAGKGANTQYFISCLSKTPAFSVPLWDAPLRKTLVLWVDLRCMLWTYVQVVKQKKIFNFPLKQTFSFMCHLHYLLCLTVKKILQLSLLEQVSRVDDLVKAKDMQLLFPLGLKWKGGCCSLITGIRASGLCKCI